MKEQSFAKDAVVFREGEPGSTMYEILSGSVGVYTDWETEEQKELTTLQAGQLFGEMAILEGYPRSTTIVSVADDTRVNEITRDELITRFKSDESFVRNLMCHLSHRLRAMTNEYLEVCKTIKEFQDSQKGGAAKSDGLLARIKYFIRQAAYNRDDKESETLEVLWEKQGRRTELDGTVRPRVLCNETTPIFRKGDQGDCMYYVFFGSVGIYDNFGEKDEKRLATLKEGEFFGEMGMFEKLPRSATAIAEEGGTYVEQIFEEDIHGLMETSPSFLYMALRHLSSRLRAMTNDYLKACRTVAEMAAAEKENRELEAAYREAAAYYSTLYSYNFGTVCW